jgi:hypothetical protein
MKTIIYKLGVVLAMFIITDALQAQRTCGMTEHMQELLSDPEFAQDYQKRQMKFEAVQAQSSSKSALCANPVVLPVAVHYQGLGSPSPCLVALAQNQVDILNNDYHGTNSDIVNWTSGASSLFPGVAFGETCVEFCLATNNHPAGYGLADGEPAVTFSTTSGDFNSDWAGYINIWVRTGTGVLGYSPLGGSGNGDGVVIDAIAFGSGAGCPGVVPGAPYNLGRTLTHELGHYMNLDHIWGGGCGADDGVADTPDSSGPYFGCPTNGVSTCSSTDMHMSYMDYTDDACMYMFSAGQSTRMENWVSAALSGVASNATAACSSAPPCPNTIIYLPNIVGSQGPALVLCETDPVPPDYSAAGSQECAQTVIDNDPFCLDSFWDQICQNAYDDCTGNGPTCADGIQNGDETGVDCGGEFCPPCNDCLILLPLPGVTGPAVIYCPEDVFPDGYSEAYDQACAQNVIDLDPFCLGIDGGFWDQICQEAYLNCQQGLGCPGSDVEVLLPALGAGVPAIVQCSGGVIPAGYTLASNQSCAMSVVIYDPFCLGEFGGFWDGLCQGAYDNCVSPPCSTPSDLAVVEIGFGGPNARVNATWTNANGTTDCEVRGGRISPSSYAAGEPEFANPAQTRTITQTDGTTVLFNIVLYNNPNVPFIEGQRYGYDVRCQCADGSGYSEWANITPASTFVVPFAPAGTVSESNYKNAGISSIMVFPNPAEDVVNIEIDMLEEGSAEILLMNALGQTVIQDRASGKTTINRLDVSDLDAGIYMLSVRTATGIITDRLIVK